MTETIPIRVQHKRMSAQDWASSTLVLLDGELGVESDTGKVKVGNGRDRFSALQYLTGPKGDRGDRGETGPRGADGVMRFENLTTQQREGLRGDNGHSLNAVSYTHLDVYKRQLLIILGKKCLLYQNDYKEVSPKWPPLQKHLV